MLVPVPNAAHPAYTDEMIQDLRAYTADPDHEMVRRLLRPSGVIVQVKQATIQIPFAWRVWVDDQGQMCAGDETGLLMNPGFQPGDYMPPVFPASQKHVQVTLA
jgi:hypothetical protein